MSARMCSTASYERKSSSNPKCRFASTVSRPPSWSAYAATLLASPIPLPSCRTKKNCLQNQLINLSRRKTMYNRKSKNDDRRRKFPPQQKTVPRQMKALPGTCSVQYTRISLVPCVRKPLDKIAQSQRTYHTCQQGWRYNRFGTVGVRFAQGFCHTCCM